MIQETTKLAYKEAMETGLIGQLQGLIYYEICHSEYPLTALEIRAMLTGSTFKNSGSICTRFSELARIGVIRITGKRKCTISGYAANTYKSTLAMPVKIEKPPNRKRLILDKIMDLELRLMNGEKEMLNEIYRMVKAL
jgi:hypothetical protein